MKTLLAIGLLLVAGLATPTASPALEARGVRHAIPCFMCAPDIVESFHIARSTAPAAVVLQTNIYDTNGILLGNFILADPAGTFLARQVVFSSSQALTQAALPAGLYSAVLFDSLLVTNIFYEQVALNAAGVVGILTGRGTGPGAPYNYNTALTGVLSLTLAPDGVGITNFFVCNNPANNMAAFLGVPGPTPGQQGVAQFINTTRELVINNFATPNLFARPLSQISPGGTVGGSLNLIPPGATMMSCVRFLRFTAGATVGGYTY